MTLTIIFGLGRYFCLKQMNAASAGELDSHIHTQAHTQAPRTPGYKKLTRTTLNSTECFSKRLIMVLKHVSLCIDPGKAKAAMGTKRGKKTMNSKFGVFQLKKPQLIWEVAEHISCFQFYSSEIFHPSFCICLASHITVTHQSPQELGF